MAKRRQSLEPVHLRCRPRHGAPPWWRASPSAQHRQVPAERNNSQQHALRPAIAEPTPSAKLPRPSALCPRSAAPGSRHHIHATQHNHLASSPPRAHRSHPQTPRRPPPRPAAAPQKPAHPVAPATGCTLRPTTARAPARSPPYTSPPQHRAVEHHCGAGTAPLCRLFGGPVQLN